LEIFLFWLVASIVVGVIAKSRGRSGIGWFFLATLISPILGLILVMCLDRQNLPVNQRIDQRFVALQPSPNPSRRPIAVTATMIAATIVLGVAIGIGHQKESPPPTTAQTSDRSLRLLAVNEIEQPMPTRQSVQEATVKNPVQVANSTIEPSLKARESDESLIAIGLCSLMESYINTLVDYTTTKCVPLKEAGGLGFIFISSKPVFSSEAAKKAWMLTIAGAFGLELNARPNQKIGNIYLTDVDRAKKLQYQVLKGASAKALQRQVKLGQISLDTMWSRLSASLKVLTGKVG
jgi:hypothetical protein